MSTPPFQIVRKTEPLTEEYLPAEFIGRQAKIRDLFELMTLPGYRGRGVVAWLHGPPGSGKSSAARRVLLDLEERQIRTAYVNCWIHSSLYSALDAILVELGTMARVTRDKSFKFERLHAIASRQPVAIAIDEVDHLARHDLDALLYGLSRLPGAKVMCLTHTRESYVHLDPRVHSRVQPLFLDFAAYTTEDLLGILSSRADASLAPDTWCVADLEMIVAASSGDARIAIQSLRTAAFLSEKHHSSHLRPQDIREGIAKSSELRRKYTLSRLPEQHRLLYAIVREAGEISISSAWAEYQRISKVQGSIPVARRTFNEYRRALVASKLLSERQAPRSRNVIVLRVNE